MDYTELQVTSNFSFLRGASHPDELAEQAFQFGYRAIAITDRNTLAGIVRAHSATLARGLRLIVGCRLDIQDGPSVLAYPENKEGYQQLCMLLSRGNLRTEKGKCLLYKKDLFETVRQMKLVVVSPAGLGRDFEFDMPFRKSVEEYREVWGPEVYLSASRSYKGDDLKKLYRIAALADHYQLRMVATNDVHYHHPDRRQLQDVVTCIREKCTISNAGYLLHENAERFLKPPVEMKRLFRHYPQALMHTREIAEACTFSLNSLQYVYPEEITSEGRTPQEELTLLAWKGAREMFGENVPQKTATAIRHELRFIEEMNYASYFLTVHDIVRYARENRILCQGRGSAANSTVCFCLGITSVNPEKFDLLFERFLSAARNEPPDIDVDFEHERREEVIQYIYAKYGRDRAAIVATVTQQHFRGAIRDVGKAMGLSPDTVDRLAHSAGEYTTENFEEKRIEAQGIPADDPHLKKVLELTGQYIGFPRQLGQHTGGFVITRDKLFHLCPLIPARMENRTNIEWNKDDIDALGFLKVDVLALGMLTCIRKAFDLARQHYQLELTLAKINEKEDPRVYEMISNADTIGVFQIESRAQQSMLPRLRPKNFYDLVIEVAIVRPGPIQGDMVHPYLRRRNHLEAEEYPSEELKAILGRTLGVPLFQEQAMKIAIVAAGFSPGEADALRRSMATFKAKGLVSSFHEKLISGMLARGYTLEFAQRIFRQLEGFGSYGFPESHAASFALLVYVSSWLKCYYPDVFACALLNSQPMGFYAPAQIVSDAVRHGVLVRPVDVNYSSWDHILESEDPDLNDGTRPNRYFALRLGFRQIRGMKEDDIRLLCTARVQKFTSVHAIRDAGVSVATLEMIAGADGFNSMGLDRRMALWEITSLQDRPVGLFRGQHSESRHEPPVTLPLMTASEQVVHDYAATSFSLKAHPVSFVREKMEQLHIVTASRLPDLADGTPVKIAGLVLVRQRPGTAAGICFITLEDETGVANLVVFKNLFETYRKEILQSKLLMAEGSLQKEGAVIHVIVKKCFDLTPLLRGLTPVVQSDPPVLTLARPDEKDGEMFRDPRDPASGSYARDFPKGRNFR